MGERSQFEVRCLHSLAKVFGDTDLFDQERHSLSALYGEIVSFQAAYRAGTVMKNIKVAVESDLADRIRLYQVGLVPSEYPCTPDHDDLILRSTPGLYPDPLIPLDPGNRFWIPPLQWRALWISIDVTPETVPGIHKIRILFETEDGERIGETVCRLEVIPVTLPPQKLLRTEWLHADCLALHYGVPAFSEEHWALLERYVAAAAEHGVNMMLTPLFTPATETYPGRERLTVQLVDVIKEGDGYTFGFVRLTRWVNMCRWLGITHFEFTHFFTQWGAASAPKIMADVNGETRRIFGWETDASSEQYRHFLRLFIHALLTYLRENGLERSCYFHISDEPKMHVYDSYKSASDFLLPLLKDYPVIDALRDIAFYDHGLVKQPVPATNFIEPFLERKVPGLWAYYCCSQYNEVSNRFFNMPSSRNRIIGMQLYKYDIEGFLHWGYNYWYQELAVRMIDPYRVTDGVYRFPSGDAFLVYPGDDGPVLSIRMKVFHEAMQDMRAFELLAGWIGKEEVIRLLESGAGGGITFRQYPLSAEWLLDKREAVNRLIADCAAGQSCNTPGGTLDRGMERTQL
jgi:hypothetical protein